MTELATRLRANGITTPLEDLGDGLFGLTTGGATAVPLWRKLRTLTEVSGYWPVIMGDRQDALDTLSDAREVEASPVLQTLKKAESLDVAEWIRRKRDEDPDVYADIDEGPWTPDAADTASEFALPFDILSKRPHPQVLLALAPTRLSHEVPAHLRIGGWNDCPGAEVHVAFARRWQERYGAEIVCAGRDIIEMAVARPPTTREEAMVLAREQYMYCYDIVEQGVGTVSNLGATLLNGKLWYFWWD